LHTEILVIGGGPAGLAAALAARQRGFEVMLAERAIPPIDKACGEGLMPDGIEAARRLGIDLEEMGHPFRGIRFSDGLRSAESEFRGCAGLGVRRTNLHRLMVERADAAGVHSHWGARVDFTADSVTINGEPVQARWIVGADGGQSTVRRWAGLEASTRQSRRFGFRRHYRLAPWSEFMELHWGKGCQLYITPVGPDEICAVLISRDQYLRVDAALEQFPEVAARLRAAGAPTLERGGITAMRRLKAVHKGRVALVGDASGSVDAITGEGLCLLFQQAVALADAFAAEDLSLYAAAHRRIGRRPRMMADLMLALDRHAGIRKTLMGAFAAHPRFFAETLRFHVGKTA
jgi:flavin-dependent dehydrogenase